MISLALILPKVYVGGEVFHDSLVGAREADSNKPITN